MVHYSQRMRILKTRMLRIFGPAERSDCSEFDVFGAINMGRKKDSVHFLGLEII